MAKPYGPSGWNRRISWRRAMFWVALSVCIVTGSAVAASILYHAVLRMRAEDPRYALKVLQAVPHTISLPDSRFKEWIGINYYEFPAEEARAALERDPWIRKAEILLLSPDTLQIDYWAEIPIARLGNVEGAALSANGVVLPLEFDLQPLPTLYLEDRNYEWGESLKGADVDLAFELLFRNLPLKTLDVSRARHPKYGKREVIATFSNQGILRLSAKDPFSRLRVPEEAKVYDLRIPRVALVAEKPSQSNNGPHEQVH